MITRYFSQNPWVSGPLEFLAGFGQQRQRVKEVEAGLQAQQDRDFAQSLGSGILTAGQAIGGGLQRRGEAKREAATAAARLQGLFDLENLRSGNQLRQSAEEALFKASMGGGDRGFPGGGYSGEGGYSPSGFGGAESIGPPSQFESPEFAGPPAPEFVGPPAPETGPSMAGPQTEAGAVPSPSIDPANTKEYQTARRKVLEFENDLEEIKKSGASQADIGSAIFALAPEMAEQRRRMQRYARPAPPKTDDEVFAGGEAIRIKGTNNVFLRDPQTGGLKVSSGLHPTATNEPRTATAFDGRTIEIVPKNPVQLDESTWYVEDEDGKPHFYGKTDDNGGSKEVDRIARQADANVRKDQGRDPTEEELRKEARRIADGEKAVREELSGIPMPPEPEPGPGFFERMGDRFTGRGIHAGTAIGTAMDLFRGDKNGETKQSAQQKLDAIGAKYHGDVHAMPLKVIAEAKRLRELTK